MYHIYIDESGNHDLENSDQDGTRFLSLTGVAVSDSVVREAIEPQMQRLKDAYFPRACEDPPVILHRADLVNRRPPFATLRDPELAASFDRDLLALLQQWEYQVVTVVIDKQELCQRYRVYRYHPYHYCLDVLLERYLYILRRFGARGDVIVESRGKKEDKMLRLTYQRLLREGTGWSKPAEFLTYLSSTKLRTFRKKDNQAGLQLADLIAHPSQRGILAERGLINGDGVAGTFGSQICAILEKDKYCRSGTGKIMGYGKKLLP